MIKTKLVCDKCGKEYDAEQELGKTSLKKYIKGMIFIDNFEIVSSGTDYKGYHSRTPRTNLFFCNYQCLRLYADRLRGK